MIYVYKMNMSLGYIKDFLACIGFFICFLFVYFTTDIQILKPFILFVLLFGFIVDGCFTSFPSLHNKNILFKSVFSLNYD